MPPARAGQDALSFLVSVVFLEVIRASELRPAAASSRRSVRSEIGEGLLFVLSQVLLRALAGTTALILFFSSMFQAVYMLYLSRTLAIGPALIGAIFAMGSVGGLVGALLTARITRWFGYGPAIIGGVVVLCIGALGFAAVPGPSEHAAPLLALAWFVVAAGNVVNNITMVSVGQALVPDQLRGRVSATTDFLSGGIVPLVGALLGGTLGSVIGLHATVVVASVGMLLPTAWVALSPLRALHDVPPTSGMPERHRVADRIS